MAEEIKNAKAEDAKAGQAKEIAEKLLAAKSKEERLNIVAEAGLKLSDKDLEKIAGGWLNDNGNNENNWLDDIHQEVFEIMSHFVY